LEEADPERVVALEEALAFMPERLLGHDEAERVSHGVAVAEGEVLPDQVLGGAVRLTYEGKLLAIARPGSGAELKPFVVFAP
jgi:hypothetical protein